MVHEKTTKRDIAESHHDRTALKHENNDLHRDFGVRDEYAHFDDPGVHDRVLNSGKPQTWYFAIADCKGHLEIFRDEDTKRDHLLGLNLLWEDIDESLFKGESASTGLTRE